jgi:hypothetical protein
MSIEISENTLGVWFVSWGSADWMGGLWRTPKGPAGAYRFRYYRDTEAFNSKDEKSWYDLNPSDLAQDEGEWIAAMSKLSEVITHAQEGQRWELLRGSMSVDEFMEAFKKLPFAHVKTFSPDECRFVMKEHGVSVTVTAIHKATGKRASATGPANRKDAVRKEAMHNLGELLFASPKDAMTRDRVRVTGEN